MIALIVFLGSVAAGLLMLGLLWRTLNGEKLSRTNYRGAKIATAAGMVIVPSFLLVYLPVMDYVSRALNQAQRTLSDAGYSSYANWTSLRSGMNLMLVVVFGFCILGLIDDVAGDSGAKGFKGHFSEALRGRFTTGLVKAFLGLVVALVALQPQLLQRAPVGFENYAVWVMDAAIIALSANFFNLLDLRPGRALKVYFPLTALCVGLTLRFETVAFFLPTAEYPLQPLYFYVTPALAVTAVALVLFWGDLREKFMLGDAGSNVLGAVIGLGLVLGTSFWWRLGVLVVVLVLNILSEKYSFSNAIASNRALNWIDSLGRKGQGTLGDNNT